MDQKGQADIALGFFGALIFLIGGMLSFVMAIFPIIVWIAVFVIIIGIIFVMYFSVKKKFEKIDLFTPRQVTYMATIESSLALKNPLMYDMWISGDGRTPQIKLGNVVGFNSEPSKIKSLRNIKHTKDGEVDEENSETQKDYGERLTKSGLDIIYTLVFADTKGFIKKILPQLKPVRVFRRDILDGNLLGSIILRCSGIRKRGFYYYPTTYGNYDQLYLEHLSYENMEASYEKAQDKWGEFADSNIKQKQWFLMDVEKSKTTIDMPFGAGKKKEKEGS